MSDKDDRFSRVMKGLQDSIYNSEIDISERLLIDEIVKKDEKRIIKKMSTMKNEVFKRKTMSHRDSD